MPNCVNIGSVAGVDPLIGHFIQQELVYLQSRYSDRDYHNAEHAAEVIERVREIGARLVASDKLTARDVQLLTLAAVFHDHEQDLGSGANEARSADVAAAAMADHPEIFSAKDIAKVRAAIMATRVEFVDGKLRQVADPNDVFAAALADSDMAHLGGPIAIPSSLQLNQELQTLGGTGLDSKVSADFLAFSAELMGYHQYHLEESRELFANGTRNNAQTMSLLQAAFASGSLSYEQLLSDAQVSTAKGANHLG